jgi:predicted RNA-binding Zn ribbon-like protein
MFQLVAGHPALDFVNTLDDRFLETGPNELLPSFAELVRFAAQSRLLSAEQARKLTRDTGTREAQRVLASAIELREALGAVLYARMDGAKLPAGQVAILQRQFHEMAVHRTLRTAKSQLVWSWAGQEQQPEIPLWKLAEAASDLLVSTEADLLKECGAPNCRWLFLDTSKNHTRRWCDMKVCGNRMKARRFQARAAGIP